MKKIVFFNNIFDINKGSGSGAIRCSQVYHILKKYKEFNINCTTNLNNIINSHIICVKGNNQLNSKK